MACNGSCGCGRCGAGASTCSTAAPVRLRETEEAKREAEADARGAASCPTFFEEYEDSRDDESREAPARWQMPNAPELGEAAAGAKTGGASRADASDGAAERDDRERPAAWSARRTAADVSPAFALVGLAVGGSLLHHVWQNR